VLISRSKRFVLFAPWKTASQTIRLRLGKYDQSSYPPFFYFNTTLNRVVHQHLTCSDFLALPESKLDYFKASFVRNPYDRVYSGFLQLQRDIEDHRRSSFSPEWIRKLVKTQLDENLAQLAEASFNFDAWWASVPEHLVFEAGRNTSFPLHPANYWTHVDKVPYVSFVGKVEQFEQDFAALCQRLDIQDAGEGNANFSAAASGSTPGSPRYASRMNRASLSKINTLFQDDFDLFGYDILPG
jgi:hypothetical protein